MSTEISGASKDDQPPASASGPASPSIPAIASSATGIEGQGRAERAGGAKLAEEAEGAAFDPTRILFHGSGVLVVDKPAGIPVHRGTSHDEGLAERIEAWVTRNPGFLEIRAGKRIHPVHRLDLEASGVLLLALNPATARNLHAAFEGRLVGKRYLAVVAGPLQALGELQGKVRTRLRGVYRYLESTLRYRRIRGDERLSLVEVIPEGGRTHQIRELFAQAERPLAGDLRYGKPTPSRQFLERFGVSHLLLHLLEVSIPPEILGAARTFRAPVPAEFHKVIQEKGWEPIEGQGEVSSHAPRAP